MTADNRAEAEFPIPEAEARVYVDAARASLMPIAITREGGRAVAHLGPADGFTFARFWETFKLRTGRQREIPERDRRRK